MFTRHSGVALLFTAGILWGLGGVSGRMLAQSSGSSPIAVAFIRTAIGGAAIVVVALTQGLSWPRRRQALPILGTGLLIALFQASYFAAVAAGSVTAATLVTIGLTPIFVLVIESLSTRTISLATASTVATAILALGLLVGSPTAFAEGSIWSTTALAALSACAFATTTVLVSGDREGLHPLTLSGGSFLVAAVPLGVASMITPAALTPAALSAEAGPQHWGWTPTIWAAVLGIGATAIPYALYFIGLRRESASLGSIMALLEPLTAALIAAALFHERLGATGWLGAALLAAAVVAAGRRAVRSQQ